MILVQAKVNIDPTLFHIDKFINFGMRNGAAKVATLFENDTKQLLRQKVFESGGNWTGNLSDAISIKDGNPGSVVFGFSRYDIVVNTTKAPYAAWVEFGNSTIYLPYYKTGTRDYAKSSFKGHKYLSNTLRKYKKNSVTLPIVATEIARSLLGDVSKTVINS